VRLSLAYLVASLLLVFALAGCSNEQSILTPAPDGTVRIVSSLPARGPAAGQARAIEDAISLAIRERGGKAGGFQVNYVQLDDSSEETGEWSREKELANATAAVNDPSVVAYIGPYSSGAAAVSLPITNRAGLLQVSPSATWPGLTATGWDTGEPERYFPTGQRNFLRMMPPDSVQAEAAARWSADLNYKSVVVVEDGSSYSNGMADTFSRAAAPLAITITARLTLAEVADGIQTVRFGAAVAVFYAPSTVDNAVKVARALAPSGLPIFSTDTALAPKFIDQAGSAATRWLVLSNAAVPDLSRKFAAPQTSSGNTDEFESQFAANAYTITSIILDGIASGTGRDRSALVSFVRSARAAGSGDVQLFNQDGDPTSWIISGYRWGVGAFTFDRAFSGP
jgi:branched-chain amino acid transport system substrate-binding protein